MLKIVSAFYDELDVTDKVKSLVKDDKLSVTVSNDIFTDPKQFKVKRLEVVYEINGDVKKAFAYEGSILEIPDTVLDSNKILLLTSCNRIKQVILGLTINSYIIKEPFHLVIADSSTPTLSLEDGVNSHNKEPYNHVTQKNYCSDIFLFEKYINFLPNVISYKMIHVSPRIEKVQGDASLITIGLAQASLIGDIKTKENFCLKLTGVAILRDDILSNLDSVLANKDVLTYHRSHFGHGEYSSRVFGCRPEVVSSITQKAGWLNWVNPRAGDTEFRLADIINNYIPADRILYTKKDESCLIENRRDEITKTIINNKIPLDNPIIKEFMDGGII